MTIQPVYDEQWCYEAEAYVATDQILGYRAISEDGQVWGWGDTVQEAEDCLRRILWRM